MQCEPLSDYTTALGGFRLSEGVQNYCPIRWQERRSVYGQTIDSELESKFPPEWGSAMRGDEEITVWIAKLANGDQRAAEIIWRAYFEKLVRFARRKMELMPRREGDEEDVALSAMNSFCAGVAAGRFPHLDDREDLWKLLVTIAARKAWTAMRRSNAEKRGGGTLRGESVFGKADDEPAGAGIDDVLGREPTPEFAAMVAENYQRLLDILGDDQLREVARLRLEGHSNEEIADRLQIVSRSVERKLGKIRDKWARELVYE